MSRIELTKGKLTVFLLVGAVVFFNRKLVSFCSFGTHVGAGGEFVRSELDRR